MSPIALFALFVFVLNSCSCLCSTPISLVSQSNRIVSQKEEGQFLQMCEPPAKSNRTEASARESVSDDACEKANKYFATTCLFVLPPASGTPYISDSIVRKLLSMIEPHKHKPHLEAEIRFCALCEDGGQRLRIPIETAAVITSSRVKKAESGLMRRDFDRLLDHLRSAFDFHVPRACGAAAINVTHTRDINRSGVRESFDFRSGVSLGMMKKQRLVIADICCPKNKYDLRFALNQEVPVGGEGSKDGGFAREKKRTSFVAGPFAFDSTAVISEGRPSYEFEIELSISKPDDMNSLTFGTLLANAMCLLDML